MGGWRGVGWDWGGVGWDWGRVDVGSARRGGCRKDKQEADAREATRMGCDAR